MNKHHQMTKLTAINSDQNNVIQSIIMQKQILSGKHNYLFSIDKGLCCIVSTQNLCCEFCISDDYVKKFCCLLLKKLVCGVFCFKSQYIQTSMMMRSNITSTTIYNSNSLISFKRDFVNVFAINQIF